MNSIKALYAYITDHMTKALGFTGTSVMSLALIDPSSIHQAATVYLGEKSLPKIGIVLFLMVIFRGWYTGRKAAQIAKDASK